MPGVKGRSGGARKGAGCKPGQGGGVREGAGCKPGQGGGAREGAGRKPFEPTKEQRVVAERGAAFGLTLEQIALMIVNPTTGEPIGATTLREHFRDELDKGHPAALLSVANALYRNATQRNNVTAQIFYLKTRGKWSEAPLDVNATLNGSVSHTGVGLGDIGEQLVAAIARLRSDGSGDESGDSETYRRTTH